MMNRKLMWLGALGALVALVYAQTIIVRGAVGMGTAGAPDSTRPNARFNFRVVQISYNDQVRLRGYFAFGFRGERLVDINMREVARFSANLETGVAEFAGPGVATIRTPSGIRRERGIVFVKVQDNRGPNEPNNDPDTLTVAFRVNLDTPPIFTYRGVVKQGDIRVFEERH